MTNSKSTKRALVASALAILMCVAMLIGTTFAWFTDTASTGVNKIQAGNLKVDIVGAESNEHVEKLNFTKAAGAEGEEILWEPGCRYLTEGFRIANKGNLALKWKVQVNKGTTAANEGNYDLLDVIDFYLVTGTGEAQTAELLDEFSGNLKKNETSTVYYIKGVMQTAAGNDYQGLSLDGITITVVATQDTVEYDSFDDQYDAAAEYPNVPVGKSLKEVFADANIDFGYGNTTSEPVVLNGNGAAIVEKWEDAWFSTDTTIKGVTFNKGAVFNAQADNITLTLEDCTFYGCSQAELLVDNVQRTDNSGDGLCLNIETRNHSGVKFAIKNCRFIGDGSENVTRFSKILVNNAKKARGHAIGLNVSEGKCDDNPTLHIEGCTIDNVRGNAIQLYGTTGQITIKDTKINSWGVNKEHKDYAIRGDFDATNGNKTITLTNVTFGQNENKLDGYEIGHVNVVGFPGNTNGTRAAGTYSYSK